MKDFRLIDHIQTAVAVIDSSMTVVDANEAFKNKNAVKPNKIIGARCYQSAYKLNESCNNKTAGICPVRESFKTKKNTTVIHHLWIDDQAIVEEVIATPIIEDNGEVNFVVEEFRDITRLLGLNKGIISMCSYCRKIRDEDGSWLSLEAYLEKHTGTKFSHGICEDCSNTLFGDLKKQHSCSH